MQTFTAFRNWCLVLGFVILCASGGWRSGTAAADSAADKGVSGLAGRTPDGGPAPENGAATSNAEPQDAWHYLERQVSFGPRNPGSDGHRKAIEFILSELEKSADDVQVRPFDAVYEGTTYSMANITALFKSSSGEEEPFILLAAHFDTRPRAEHDPLPARRLTPIMGANDGASGVAVLLEIAGVLARTKPPVPVMIAFFDGEDLGASADSMFLGSRRLAESLDPRQVTYMLLVDMVGDADLNICVEGYSQLNAPDVVDTVWSTAERLGYGSTFSREVRYHILDDHVPFIEKGVPAVDIIDFDYPYWHTTLDTLDKCSATSLRTVRDVVLETIFQGGAADPSQGKPEVL
ncbi:MAG: M28 family peptidase [Betaproteobacteria bacterium]